jgi:predicted DNA-binding transcriptional regulator AlpA
MHSKTTLRVRDLVNDPKRGTRGLLNIGRSTLHAGVKAGILPQPVYIGERTPVWRQEDIDEFLKTGIQKISKSGKC